MEGYSTFKIARMLNTTRAAVQMWIDKDLIQPSLYAASGPGTKSLFSKNDIYRIFLFKLLQESGLRQSEAASISRKIDLEKFSKDRRYIVLKRKKLNNKFNTRTLITNQLTQEHLSAGDGIELTIIIDGKKLLNIIDSLK